MTNDRLQLRQTYGELRLVAKGDGNALREMGMNRVRRETHDLIKDCELRETELRLMGQRTAAKYVREAVKELKTAREKL